MNKFCHGQCSQGDLFCMALLSLPLSIPGPLAFQDSLPMVSFCQVTAVVSALPATQERFDELGKRSWSSSMRVLNLQSRKPVRDLKAQLQLLHVKENLLFYQPLILTKLQESDVYETFPLSLIGQNPPQYNAVQMDRQYDCMSHS